MFFRVFSENYEIEVELKEFLKLDELIFCFQKHDECF